jgi:hypothetical protein
MQKWDILDLWVEEDRKHLYLNETYPYKILVGMHGAKQALEVFVTDHDSYGWFPAGLKGLPIENNRRLPSGFRRILLGEEFQELTGLEAGNTINLRLAITEKYGEDAAELFGKILRLEMVY